jgi:hypothetical protein
MGPLHCVVEGAGGGAATLLVLPHFGLGLHRFPEDVVVVDVVPVVGFTTA